MRCSAGRITANRFDFKYRNLKRRAKSALRFQKNRWEPKKAEPIDSAFLLYSAHGIGKLQDPREGGRKMCREETCAAINFRHAGRLRSLPGCS